MSWRRKWQLPSVFLPGKSHGQRRLVSYSPWGHKGSDMTEWLNTHRQVCCHKGLSMTPRTVAWHTPLSMKFSGEEYCFGLAFPSPGDNPDLGMEPTSLVSLVLQMDSLTTAVTWETRWSFTWRKSRENSFLFSYVSGQDGLPRWR